MLDEERQPQLNDVLATFLPPPEPAPPPQPATPVSLDDEELLERARAARNGPKFERLWAGDASGYGSASEADLALCSLLAFWTAHDPDRIDHLFRASGLMRPKWERADYRERTITEAAARCRSAYQPRRPQPVPEPDSAELISALKSVTSVTPDAEFAAEGEAGLILICP